MNLVVSIHVVLAIFVLGPLVFTTSATPRAVRSGDPELVRFVARTSRVYVYASIVVPVLGLSIVQRKYGYGFGQLWIWLSLVLYVVALGLETALVLPAQRRVVAAMEARAATGGGAAGTDGTARPLGVIAAAAGLAALAFAAIAFLMIYKPGLGS